MSDCPIYIWTWAKWWPYAGPLARKAWLRAHEHG